MNFNIRDLFNCPVFPDLPAPAEHRTPFGSTVQTKARRREQFPSDLVAWDGCNVKKYEADVELSGIGPNDENMELTPFLQRRFEMPLDIIQHTWKLRHRQAAMNVSESFQVTSISGHALWFLLHNIALAASQDRNVTFRFFKESRSSSVPSSTISEREVPQEHHRLPPDPVQEQHPGDVRRSMRIPKPTEKAISSKQEASSSLVTVGQVLSGASRITCQVDSVICQLLPDPNRAIAKVVCEFKGTNTLGLVDEGQYDSNSIDRSSLTWEKVVTDALQAFGRKAQQDHIYGSLIQLLNSMIVKGAEVGLLHDLQTYIFVELRRRASENGSDRPETFEQLTAADFTVSFLVKRYSDCEPTMQQVLVHFLRKYEETSAAWVKTFCPRENPRRHVLIQALSRLASTSEPAGAEPGPHAPSETDVLRARGSGSQVLRPMQYDGSAPNRFCAKAFDFKVEHLGFQVALSNTSPIWHYGARGEHVLKLAHWDNVVKSACMERELQAYEKASRLQGSVLLRLHDYGGHAHARVDVLELDYVCVPLGILSRRFREPKVAAAIWQAFRALWAEGVAHCDIHEGNICVLECKGEGDNGNRYDVTILDLGCARV